MKILRACHWSILKDTIISFEHFQSAFNLHSYYFCTSRLETPKPVLPYCVFLSDFNFTNLKCQRVEMCDSYDANITYSKGWVI